MGVLDVGPEANLGENVVPGEPHRIGEQPRREARVLMRTENRNEREYLYIEQLAELTPWTPQAIRTLASRGKLKQGVHFFKPMGPTSRPIFRWSAVRDFIENGDANRTGEGAIVLANGAVVDVEGNDAAVTVGLRE